MIPRLGTRTSAEGLGTFLLVLFGPGAAVVGHAHPGTIPPGGVAVAFLLAVACLVLLFGPISGSHINPAVTIVLALTGRFPRSDVLPYIAAQLGGATAAALVLAWGFPTDVSAAATVPVVAWPAALAIEMLLSCLLMLTVMRCIDDTHLRPFETALAIGGVVGVDALVGGPLTGASMNPARSFGPAVASGRWDIHWAYWVAPIAGMLVAALLHDHFRKPANVEQ